MIETSLNSALSSSSLHGSPATASNQVESPAHKRLRKGAEEFEGMSIAQLLGDFTMSFTSLTGGDEAAAGSSTLNSLAVQTLSRAMAARGGFGIANMLIHQLEPSLSRGK